jgi:DNA polymerase
MESLHIDFETTSKVSLTACGPYVYATDPSTDVLCLQWAIGDDKPRPWVPGQRIDPALRRWVDLGKPLEAWNAQFERLIWAHVMPRHGFPRAKPSQWYCTAARARAHGLPGKLGLAARALGLDQLKLDSGRDLILKYSQHGVRWDEIPAADQALWLEYCAQDVIVERAIGDLLRELTPDEWAEYHHNERVNDRGVPLDLKLAAAALEYAQDVRSDVAKQVKALTRGKVTRPSERKARDAWLLPQLTRAQRDAITKTGTGKISFDEAHRTALLALDPPAPVRRYLELLEEAGGATVSKYSSMLDRAPDGRARGVLVYNGGGQTGRYSSMGLQMHNLKRDGVEDLDATLKLLMGGYELPNVIDTLARLVRSAVYLPGKGLSWCDWSAIEGRMAPWLAGTASAEAKLDVFRRGDDPYVITAAGTFGVPVSEVTKQQRQLGKVQELAFQFLGGVNAGRAMGGNYGVTMSDGDWEALRDAWREQNPWAQRFGRSLEQATHRALRKPGKWYDAGRVSFAYDGSDWLWMRLPSGRLLAYYRPKIESVDTPWGESDAVTAVWGAGKPKRGEAWPRRALYSGLLVENATQAAAADLLRDALLVCEDEGVEVVLHVHDEIVAEGSCSGLLQEIMLTASGDWAVGLPLKAEAGEGERYGK